MDLLYKREQGRNWRGQVIFRLWVKTEMAEDERALLNRYSLEDACLMAGDDSGLLRRSILAGIVGMLVIGVMASGMVGLTAAVIGMPVAGIVTGFWWFNEKRERIFVRDVLWGRHFKCDSIIDLTKKEAILGDACAALRQVLETAKHWDGVEKRPVPVLQPEEAKALVARL